MTQNEKTPTRQDAFDMAARHLLAQGKPSGTLNGNNGFDCKYSGTGCALRPFVPDGVDPSDWDLGGGVESLVSSDQQDKVPEYISDDLAFYAALQDAHDAPALASDGDPRAWRKDWIDEMIHLAETYDLDASVVTEAA